MDTARLFQSGRSQAMLLPADDFGQTLQAGLAEFEPGFVLEREQPEAQQRDEISP